MPDPEGQSTTVEPDSDRTPIAKPATTPATPPSSSSRVAQAALLVSALALTVSARSCYVSSQSLNLAQTQHREQRLMILDGTFNAEGTEAVIRSISPAATFIDGRAIFPTRISDDEWPIRASNKILHLAMARYGMQQLFAKTVPKEKGVVQLSMDGGIPVLIDGYYASAGDTYLDRSLYVMNVEIVQNDELGKSPDVKFTGLKFVKRFDPRAWPERDYLDRLLEDKNGLSWSPRIPEIAR